MISLDNERRYFILIDNQGGSFGGGRIFEGTDELIEQFQEWADSDDYEDPKLKDWTISQCIENWDMDLKEYDGIDFVDAGDSILDYKIK